MRRDPTKFRTYGDPRSRPGRRPGPNPRVRHLSRPEVSARAPLLVTLKLVPGLGSLRRRRIAAALEDAFRACSERVDFRVADYATRGELVHVLVEADDRAALGRGMKALCARVARGVNRALEREGPVLADRYRLRVLETRRGWLSQAPRAVAPSASRRPRASG